MWRRRPDENRSLFFSWTALLLLVVARCLTGWKCRERERRSKIEKLQIPDSVTSSPIAFHVVQSCPITRMTHIKCIRFSAHCVDSYLPSPLAPWKERRAFVDNNVDNERISFCFLLDKRRCSLSISVTFAITTLTSRVLYPDSAVVT